ncbi:MAG: hypothetical protein EOP47_30240 [Sphingobacteriaceae bacterium]|nr:MAG: hypothetical protein EOP47_30240 [Sphingobacteriaceae bacterium]
MDKLKTSLHSRVHNWINTIGFRLNASQTKDNVTINHYFFETFNFFEKEKNNDHSKSQFLCFDMYGEKMPVRSLLDLQSAFFDNISQLK